MGNLTITLDFINSPPIKPYGKYHIVPYEESPIFRLLGMT